MLDTNQMLIGDQTIFRFEVIKSPDVQVTFPVLTDTLTGKVEILETLPADTQKTNNNLQKILHSYRITCFDSGLYKVAPYPFIVNIAEKNDTLYTMPVPFIVYTMPLDTTDIKDIKAPFAAPITFYELLPYILYLILAAIIIYIVFWYVQSRKKNRPMFSFLKPQDPPHVIALDLLDKLKEEKLWQQNEIKLYYSKLTDILRGYFEARFMFKSLEQTSDEIIADFRRTHVLDTLLLDELCTLLKRADMVKFAKAQPLPEENEDALNLAYKVVLSTKPQEELYDAPEKNNKKAKAK